MKHQEVALGHRLDPVAVDPDQPETTVADHCAGDLVRAIRRAHAQRERVDVVGGLARAALGDADSALARDEGRADIVEILVEKAAQQSLQRRRRDRFGLEPRGLASQADRDLHWRLGDELRGKAAQPLGQPQMRSERFQLLGRERRHIDRMADHAIDEKFGSLLRDVDRDLDLRLVGRRAQMGRRDHVVEAQQRMVFRRRLFDEHVERRARDLTRRERLGKRLLVDDSAARAVDDPHARLHHRERRRAHQRLGVVGERRVRRDEIGAPVELLQRHHLDPDSRRRLAGQNRVVADHFHLEPDRPLGHDAPDIAQTNHAEGLVADLDADKLAPIPSPCAHRRIGGRNMPRERHHHRDRMLGRGDAVAERTVHHHDSPPRRRFEVDIVYAHAGPPDHAQRIGALDDLARHVGRAAYDQSVIGRDYFGQLLRLESGLDVDLELRIAAEHLDALRIEGVAQQNAQRRLRHGVRSGPRRDAARDRGDARASLEAMAEVRERHLQRPDRDQHVEGAQITHVADAHQLAFHLILSALH